MMLCFLMHVYQVLLTVCQLHLKIGDNTHFIADKSPVCLGQITNVANYNSVSQTMNHIQPNFTLVEQVRELAIHML